MKINKHTIDDLIKDKPFKRLTEYITSKHHILWQCNYCFNTWNATPDNVFRKKSGCPECASTKTLNDINIQDILRERKISPLQSINNKNVNTRIRWICTECKHTWFNTIYNVVYKKQGCKQCYQSKRKITTFQIEQKLEGREIRLNSTTDPSNALEQLSWECLTCGFIWNTTYNSVLNNNSGCPICSRTSQYSKKAIAWLNRLVKKYDIKIIHAENDGEYIIPGTKLHVDGFCLETNTVYEFYGDYWHGNPSVFRKQDVNPHLNVQFGKLFRKTLKRERYIKGFGYNVISIWEHDFDEQEQ